MDPAKAPPSARAAFVLLSGHLYVHANSELFGQISALTIIKPQEQSTEVHAIFVVGMKGPRISESDHMFYPTFCKTPQGLRLFGTQYVHDKDGKVISNNRYSKEVYRKVFQALKVADLKDCRTVRLTSSLI